MKESARRSTLSLIVAKRRCKLRGNLIEPLFDEVDVTRAWDGVAGSTGNAYHARVSTRQIFEHSIAVIDTGVGVSRMDVDDRIIYGPDFGDDDNDSTDLVGHGTFAARPAGE